MVRGSSSFVSQSRVGYFVTDASRLFEDPYIDTNICIHTHTNDMYTCIHVYVYTYVCVYAFYTNVHMYIHSYHAIRKTVELTKPS